MISALTTGTEFIANTTDAADEKHVPVMAVTDDEVKVAETRRKKEAKTDRGKRKQKGADTWSRWLA